MDSSFLENIVSDTVDSSFLGAIRSRSDQTHMLTLLDAEVQRTASRLQRLRKYRNSLFSPIHRLAPELLSQVFFMYAEEMAGLFDLRWTKLLLVCKQWYDVGMGTSRLWSHILVQAQRSEMSAIHRRLLSVEDQDAGDVRRIEAQRVRAGRYPLTVIINLSLMQQVPSSKELYLSMFWPPSSLRSITVIGRHKFVSRILRALSTCQHPNLTFIHARVTEYPRDNTTGTDATSLEEHSLMGGILGENTPKLRSLRIHEIPLDWALVQGLRVLDVKCPPISPVPFHLDDVLGAVDRSPLLESMALSLPGTFESTVSRSRPKSTLAHINSVFLLATAAVSLQLLQALDLPSTTSVSATVVGAPSPSASLLTMAEYLGGHARQHGAPGIRSLSIYYLNMTFPNIPGVPGVQQGGLRQLTVAGHLEGSENTRARHPSPMVAPSFISLTTHAFIDPENADGEFFDILGSWPLYQIVQLDMRASESTSASWWNALLVELPALTTIAVRPEHSNAQSLVEVLRTHLAEGSGSPSLANIVFDAANVGLGSERFIDWQPMPTVSEITRARYTVMRALSYCAEAARANIPMDTVEIINEPRPANSRVLETSPDADWSELYGNLKKGFIYEGTLYNAEVRRDDVTVDSVEDS